MIFNEEFINNLKDKSVAELDESLITINDMIFVIKRLRDYKQAKAIWESKYKH